ncbi:MAG: alkaline phosphatase D family protein [Bacteroidota bacterium]
MKNACLYILMLFFSVNLMAQNEKLLPDEFFNRNDQNWYNRKTGSALHFVSIINGEPDKAIAFAKTQLPDLEAEFILAVAFAAKGEADSAMHYVNASLEKHMPIARYLAGELEVMKPLLELPKFKELVAKHQPTIINGPMLGDVTAQSAKVWFRTYQEQTCMIELSKQKDFQKIFKVISVRTDASKEYTTVANIEGLKPNTLYFYRISADGKKHFTGSFTTTSKDHKPTQFSIVFGGGAAFIPWRHQMWGTIHSHRPDALFMMGDNVYIDYPEVPQAQLYCYQQRQSEPQWRKMIAHTPVYAIWDDHDFGDNDDYGGPAKFEPAWKFDNWKRFQNQWANPAYGLGAKDPGVWFNKVIGEVEFFFLDGRYYREPSFIDVEKDHALSMLGAVQKQWLKDKLLASKAKFKVIISPVPWSFPAKAALEGKIDTWLGYPEERNEIFDFLTQNKIEGVVLLSADRHRSDLWKIEREGDYPLYEMESSRLTNTHRHPPIPSSIFSYNAKDSFGKVIFDTYKYDPELRYEIWTIDNEPVFNYTIRLSELKTTN